MERAVAQVNGVTIVAYANQWDAYPRDLADYVTPIAVELFNPGPYEVRVTYADIALRDPRGFRYSAINPYIPATTVGETEQVKPVMLAAVGPTLPAGVRGGVSVGPPGGVRGGASISAPRGVRMGGGRMIVPGARVYGPAPGVVVGPPGVRRFGWGYAGGGWNGYLVHGGLRPYYGWGVGYWGGPWLYPPWYYDWVVTWGPAYYPAQPSTDVLSLGLPEGVLPPGSRVSGFLFFKRATGAHQSALDLSWDIRDARSGAALGQAQVPLQVVHL
jgi:hypothetical protein